MKTMTSAAFVIATFAVALGCGYSKPANTPAMPGTMPAIAQLSPDNVIHGSAQFTLTVDGSSFASNAFVKFNGANETTTWTSSGKLEATIPASAIVSSGTVPVTVTNPGTPGGLYGGGTSPATSTAMNFTID